MKDTDLITTVVGGLGAAVTAVTPVMTMIQPGTAMHAQDWTQLVFAALMGIFSFFTNKKAKEVPAP